jgi:hypothetical protein
MPPCQLPAAAWVRRSEVKMPKPLKISGRLTGLQGASAHPIAHPRVYFWYLKWSFLQKYLLCTQGDSGGRKFRDQEVGGSNPLAPTNLFNKLQVRTKRFLRAQSTLVGGQFISR